MGEIINFDDMENAPKEDLIAKYSSKAFAPLQPPTGQNEPTEKPEYEGLTLYTKAGRNNRFRIVLFTSSLFLCIFQM